MDVTSLDIGLLVVRVGLAFILFAHSTQKALGWFSGSGVEASAALFEKLGQRPGRRMVYLASTCEMTAALSLLLGFLLPAGAAIGMGTMIVAGSSLLFTSGKFWNAMGGGEYPHVIALVLAGLAFTGPGAIAVDALYDAPWSGSPVLVGIGAIVVAVVVALGPVTRTRKALVTDS